MRLGDLDKLNMHLADVQLANRGWRDDFCEILEEIMGMVDEMPTIEPDALRPKGEWLLYGKRGIYGHMYACSECHAKYDGRSHYCPNCGAKMEV